MSKGAHHSDHSGAHHRGTHHHEKFANSTADANQPSNNPGQPEMPAMPSAPPAAPGGDMGGGGGAPPGM